MSAMHGIYLWYLCPYTFHFVQGQKVRLRVLDRIPISRSDDSVSPPWGRKCKQHVFWVYCNNANIWQDMIMATSHHTNIPEKVKKYIQVKTTSRRQGTDTTVSRGGLHYNMSCRRFTCFHNWVLSSGIVTRASAASPTLLTITVIIPTPAVFAQTSWTPGEFSMRKPAHGSLHSS